MPDDAPVLTTAQVREVDRRAVAEYGFSSLVLMENAGRGAVDLLERIGIGGPVVVVCGKGNNGGDGFVIGRHLRIRGYDPRVVVVGDPAELTGDAATNYKILLRCDVPINIWSGESATLADLTEADWIVDALLGTGARGDPRPPSDLAIRAINASPARKLAVDLPSGLDADTGIPTQPTLIADHTCTFVAPKPGFAVPGAGRYTGEVHVLDIGVPPRLIDEVARGEKPEKR